MVNSDKDISWHVTEVAVLILLNDVLHMHISLLKIKYLD